MGRRYLALWRRGRCVDDADIALFDTKGATIEARARLAAPGIVILAEDDDVLAVAKPAGMVTHPAYRHPDGTLTDAVFAYADQSGLARPWLLHRLDRETSGVVLFARNERARRALVRQIEQRRVTKRYLAVLAGTLPKVEGEISAPLCRDPTDRRRVTVSLAGKPATTRYRLLASRDGHALALVEPLTGRTHQIRAHLASLGAAVAGDATYGGASEATRAAGIKRALLHAWELVFRHPTTGEQQKIQAPLPRDMRVALAALGLADATAPEREGLVEPAWSDHVSGC